MKVNDAPLWSCVLPRMIQYRFNNNRDIKIIITARSAETGVGKTQLGMLLARFIDPDWTIERAFLDPHEYRDYYEEKLQPGQAMTVDELHQTADSRRSLAETNKIINDMLMSYRWKQGATIFMLPSTSAVDKRTMMSIDIWIQIVYPGYAHVYTFWHQDFEQETRNKRLKNEIGGQEFITWDPIDDDPEYHEYTKMKQRFVSDGTSERYDEEDVEKEKRKAVAGAKQSACLTLLEETDLTQTEIADRLGKSQGWVSMVKNKDWKNS
jgi:hypothetical protein